MEVGEKDPIPLVGFQHDLCWIDDDGVPVDYGRDGDDVAGIDGTVTLSFANGQKVQISGEGRWAQRYGQLGGGIVNMKVHSSSGWEGTAMYELTGVHHHRYFPIARFTV